MEDARTMRFDAELFEMPDGTVTAVIRSQWPSADDVVEVLGRSERRGPRRASAYVDLGTSARNSG
jgi:hypothetical protein